MDGSVRLGQRKLAIEFHPDRHGTDRIDKAYQCLETLALAKSTVQDTRSSSSKHRDSVREAQG